jgi:hypothetical protein
MLRAKRRCSPYEASPIDGGGRSSMHGMSWRKRADDTLHLRELELRFHRTNAPSVMPMRIQQEFHMLSNVVVPPTLYPIGRHVCR